MMTTPEKPMTECPSKDDLRSLSLGVLSSGDSDILLQHLDDCRSCQTELETIHDTKDSLIAGLRENVRGEAVDSEPHRDLALAKALGALALVHESQDIEDTDSFIRSIGEYEIVRPLGSGGMGRVFLARHTKLGREVALKVIADHRLSDSSVLKRFEQEMQAIGRLSHPNIVTAHDAREIDSTAVLVTEYIDGLDLGQIVRRVGPLSVADACQATKQVAVALQYTGDQGFVHRDIKPQNVMVSRTGQVKVLDLGLARIQTDDPTRTGMTGTGQTMGTADYVSPEQVTDSREVDIRSDLYSLGCTLFKLLAGTAPFATDKYSTAFAKMNAHVSEQAPSISEFREDVPKSIVKLINDLMSKDPNKRPAEPMAVARALEPFCTENNLESLVQVAMNTEPDLVSETHAEADSVKPDPVAATRWWQRRVPILIAIATGILGVTLGAALGILIKIKAPDGTVLAEVAAPQGSKVVVETVENNQKASVHADSMGNVIPLMFAIVNEQQHIRFSDRRTKTTEVRTSGSDTVEVIEDSNAIWFPVNEDFDHASTQKIKGKRYVALYPQRTKQIWWSDLQGQVLSMQSAHERVDIRLNATAGEKLSAITRTNLNKKLAIIVDGVVVSAPRIHTEISTDLAITGILGQKQIDTLMGIPKNNTPMMRSISEIKPDTIPAGFLKARAFLFEKAKTDDQAKIDLIQFDEILAKLQPTATLVQGDDQLSMNLLNLGKAMHNFHSAYTTFPASAGTVIGGSRVRGKPTQPFSWRVAILPFIEGQKLFEEYRFDEPWDSEFNTKFLDRMPEFFKSTNPETPVGHTHIQALVGGNRAMELKEGVGFRDITDGTSNTALLVETAGSVPWTKPLDVTGTPTFPANQVRILMADGRVVDLRKIDLDILEKLITRDGGEPINQSDLR